MSMEEPVATVFRYEKPTLTRSKAVTMLAKTDHIVCGVQTIREGGENNLHAHNHLDGFWFVLSGRARFHTSDDEVVAELGRYEGILVPMGYKYWFEAIGDDELELLQVEASDIPMGTADAYLADRIDYAPRKGSFPPEESEADQPAD